MPQFSGEAVKGSPADKLPKNSKGEIDGTAAFTKHMEDMGVKVEVKTVKASELKASQNELVGAKVAGMVNNKNFDPAGEAIFVSRDGYVIDGHHRWAAQIGRDLRDGRIGDLPLKVRVVDMPISQVLREANNWAKDFGIAPKSAGNKPVKKDDAPPCIGCGADKKLRRINLWFSNPESIEKRGEKAGHPFRGNQYTRGIKVPTKSGEPQLKTRLTVVDKKTAKKAQQVRDYMMPAVKKFKKPSHRAYATERVKQMTSGTARPKGMSKKYRMPREEVVRMEIVLSKIFRAGREKYGI